MKVKIGKHINWIGPYQIADLIFLLPDKYTDQETWRHQGADKLGEYLSKTWVNNFCSWVQERRKRRVYVHIDSYDVWNAGHSLSLIALPLLQQLKESKHGAPRVDDSDVPERLRSTSAPAKANDWDTDALHFDRWEWIIDEMIWAHQQEATYDPAEAECWQHNIPDSNWPYSNYKNSFEAMLGSVDCDWEKLKAVQERKTNGFRLFGKYYQALWD